MSSSDDPSELSRRVLDRLVLGLCNAALGLIDNTSTDNIERALRSLNNPSNQDRSVVRSSDEVNGEPSRRNDTQKTGNVNKPPPRTDDTTVNQSMHPSANSTSKHAAKLVKNQDHSSQSASTFNSRTVGRKKAKTLDDWLENKQDLNTAGLTIDCRVGLRWHFRYGCQISKPRPVLDFS